MNKIMIITAIVLVAVVMGFNSIAPAMAQEPPRVAPCEAIERALLSSGVDERTVAQILLTIGCR